jgi:3-oxoacyl-[acyl-carrier-protein] synthase II
MSSSNLERRIVITWAGLISPLGDSPQALWDHLIAGQSGVVPYDGFNDCKTGPRFAALASAFTGKIDNFGQLEKDQKKMIRKGLKIMSRETQMGVAAAQLAMQDAGITAATIVPERSGCLFGTDYMLTVPEDFIDAIQACSEDDPLDLPSFSRPLQPDGRACSNHKRFVFNRWGGEGLAQMTPLWLLRYLPNMPASHVAIYNDLRGPNNSLTMREAAANLAIGEAFFIIERGHADLMLVGATGTRVHPMNAIHAMQQEEVAGDDFPAEAASRPFDRDRCGMVLGEGAGVVILEELAAAESRGAKIYGEVVARGSSTVLSVHGVADRQQALQNALTALFHNGQMRVEEVGHIHAHGLSTRRGDYEEALAIDAVFGGRSIAPPVMAAKSYFGNLGAGSGIVELIASLLALRQDRLPGVMIQTADCRESRLKNSRRVGVS